ncbi:MAG: LysE family transporter [Tuberibacillus sp.]
MNVLLGYIFLGLSLAAPIGPINAAQLDRGIKYGFLQSWLIGLGASVADALYMLLVYIGLSRFIEIPLIKTFLWSFGAFILIYTGIECLLAAKTFSVRGSGQEESPLKSFFSGFFMSLFNPLTILFWLGIYGSVLAETASSFSADRLALYSTAIFSGIIIWDISMAIFSSSFRKYLNLKLQY